MIEHSHLNLWSPFLVLYIEFSSYWRINTGYLKEKLGIAERNIAQFKGAYGSPGPIINKVGNKFPLMGKNNFLKILEHYSSLSSLLHISSDLVLTSSLIYLI